MIIHQAFSPGKGVEKTSGTYIVDFAGDPAAILMNDFDRIFRKRVFRSIRSPNTLHADRAIRLNPITDYGLIRSRNSVHGDHL